MQCAELQRYIRLMMSRNTSRVVYIHDLVYVHAHYRMHASHGDTATIPSRCRMRHHTLLESVQLFYVPSEKLCPVSKP